MNLTAREGQVFIQPHGPATETFYFGKADLSGELVDELGGMSIIQRYDAVGRRVARLNVQDEIQPVQYTLTKYIGSIPDVFDKPTCPNFAVWFHQKCGGVQGNFSNYKRSCLAVSSRGTSVSRSNLVRWIDESAQRTISYSAMPPLYILENWDSKVTAVTLATLQDLVIVPRIGCYGSCLEYSRYAIGNRTDTGAATSYTTTDDGNTWTQVTTDIFTNGNSSNSIEAIRFNEESYRLIAGSSTNDAGNPMLVAYSDDEGVTWTSVTVGSSNGERVLRRDALYAWDRRNVWLGTINGRVYFSDTCGESWRLIADGFTTESITAIRFMDSVQGWIGTTNGEVWYTKDAGFTWTQATTSPSTGTITSIYPHRDTLIWITDENGSMHVSFDCGETWNERYLTTPIDEFTSIRFHNEWIGTVLASGGGCVLAITVDGGWSWETIQQSATTCTAVEMPDNYYQLNVVGTSSITSNMRGAGN